MKRIVCLLLTLTLAFSLSVSALAAERHDAKQLPRDMRFYVTRVNADKYNDADISSIDCGGKAQVQGIAVTKIDYNVFASSADPIFVMARDRIYDAISQGLVVKSINVVLPAASATAKSTLSDEHYWLNHSSYWGTNQGQDIRYFYNQLTVSTNKVKANNIPSTWSSILSSTLKVVVDRIIGFTPADKVYSAIKDIASVLGAAAPDNVNFNSALEYIKGESVGTLTYKEIVLEDVADKISGNSYYPWGTVETLLFQTRIEVKFYDGYRNGVPYYPVVTSQYSSPKTINSTNYARPSVLFPLLTQYYNYVGYQQYFEAVEINMAPTL